MIKRLDYEEVIKMNNKKYAREPLLYIEQPANSTPEVLMQYNYVTEKTEKAKELKTEHIATKHNTRPKPIRRHFNKMKEEIESPKDVEESSESNKNPGAEQPEKKFNEMSVLEKVNYLLARPEHAPKIRSEIKTQDKTYRGIVTSANDKSVFVRVGHRKSSTEVPRTEITNIRMIGL